MKLLRVLLVDDEEELIETIVERLEFRGIDARWVSSGKEALACLKDSPYDVVVIDLKMPGIDGLELKSLVEKAFPGTQILLVTGHGGSEAGEDPDVLMKPFSIETLVERILDLTEGKGAPSVGALREPLE